MSGQGGTVRDAVFALLREFGMTTVFGNPGSTELPMFRDFPQDFRYILGLQESVVMAMADGFAQANRNAALVNLHSAAGTGHALGNLFTAYRNGTPLVVTAGQQARSILPYEPFLFAQQAAEFPKPYVKWSCEPARAEDVPAAIARAYYVAMQPPMGPTFVSIPIDDWDRPCEPLSPRTVSRTVCGDPALLAEAAGTLDRAARPAIVVGAGAARDDAWDELIALAEAHGAAVWVSPMAARNAFPEDHPNFAGFLTAGREPIVAALAPYDVVLAAGAPLFVYHVEGFGPHLPETTRLFHLTDDPAAAAWLPVGTSILTNVREGVRALLTGTSRRGSPVPAVPPRATPLPGDLLTDAYCLQQVAALRPANAVVVEEAPSSRHAMHKHLPMPRRDGFYTCASGGLGHGLPAAIGVALARPNDKVIAILGDGSAMYAIQGLWTAAQLGLPISFVIVNNRRYEALIGFGRRFEIDDVIGTQLPDIDFCRIAEAQGIAAERVDNVAALDAALGRSFAAGRPTLVEVILKDE